MSLSSLVDGLAARLATEFNTVRTQLAGKANSSHTHAESDVTNLTGDLAGKAATSHSHAAADTTSGTFAIAHIPTGQTGSTVPFGNDSRFSDSRAPNGSAGGSLGGTYPNPSIAAGAVGGTEIAAAIKDAAAATASLRTLGTGAAQAAAGNDSRLSDSRAPSGAAGGQLGGTYPNPTLNYGTSSTTACVGNDSRLSDSRAPNGTAGGALNGTYPNPGLDVVPWAVQSLTDAATVAIDASLGNHFRLLMTSGVGATRAMGAPSNPTDGQRVLFEIKQDATGSRAVTWNAVYRFGALVTLPVITTGASKKDYVAFIYNATDVKWDCLAYAPGY